MGPKPRHTFFDKIKMCFDWPYLFMCLKACTLWLHSILYFLLLVLNLDYRFLTSPMASIPELFFLDLLQWTWFHLCLLICLTSKFLAYFILAALWTFKVFLCIFIEPDKIFSWSKPSVRAYNRYVDNGYQPISAYSRKYIILSCFQLHEYVDNGFSSFFHWMQTKFGAL